MNIKKHIPNLFTSLNLFTGCVASVLAFEGMFTVAMWLLLLAGLFDFLDGFMARLLKAYSPLGKELDSLADMVSFGMLPSLVVFHFLSENTTYLTSISTINMVIPYLAFLLAVFSALRLAKFNIDERQTSSFIGLPTPANAFFWVSFCYFLNKEQATSNVWMYVILGLILVFSILMISEMPMFSLKMKNFKLKGNELQYLLILVSVVSFIFLQLSAFFIIILFYILLTTLLSIRKDNSSLNI